MKLIITSLLILISSYAFSTELKFETLKIREMWYICSTKFQEVAPYLSQVERVLLCDCYVDHMRKTYTPQEVINLSPEESKKLGLSLRTTCPASINFSTKETV